MHTLADNETVFDNHTQEFKAIVGMSQELLSMDAAVDSMDAAVDEQHILSFSFDFGVTPPLYFTATHCRDPLIRRRALALLRRAHRKQGSWNSEDSAKCAEQIIKIEELGLGLVQSCKNVLEEHRIRKVYADVNHEKGCTEMGYVRAPYDLKSPLKTVYIPLRTEAKHCSVAEHLASGTKPDERTSMPDFVSKTYFPQEPI
jgi:hypothetical protein